MADSSVQASDQIGSAGATFSTDLIAGEHIPLSKIAFGAYGTLNLVDSTATNPFPVALSDTDNAVLDTIDDVLDTINAKLVTGTVIGDVNVVGSALTALQKSDDVVAVLGTDTYTEATSSGTVMAAVRNDTLAALADTDNKFAPLQVDASGALYVSIASSVSVAVTGPLTDAELRAAPVVVDLGTNNDVTVTSGSITANAGTNLNTSLLATETTVNSIKTAAEIIDNAVHVDDAPFNLTTDSVVAIGAVRDDTLAGTGTEGDILVLKTSIDGALWVVDQAQYIEGATAATNPRGSIPLLVANSTPALEVTDGQNVSQRGTRYGAAYTQIIDSSGNFIDTFGGSGGTSSNYGSAFPSAGTAVGFDDGTNMQGAMVFDADTGAGTEYVLGVQLRGAASGGSQAIAGTAANGMEVDVTRVQGTVTVSGTVTANLGTIGGAATAANQSTQLTALQLIDNPIVAHGAAISGSTGVSVVGFEGRSSSPTAVANAQATRGLATLLGKQVTMPYCLPASSWRYAAASGGITDTTGVTANAAQGAGIRSYITRCQVINGHASQSTDVQIRDGASGTVMWRGWAQAGGGGVTVIFDPPLRGTANTLVEVACGASGAAVYFNLQGYIAAE